MRWKGKRMERNAESRQHSRFSTAAYRFWLLLTGSLLTLYAWSPVQVGDFDKPQCFCLLTMGLVLLRQLFFIIEMTRQIRTGSSVSAGFRRERKNTVHKLLIYTLACIVYLAYCIHERQAVVKNSINSSLAGAAVFTAAVIISSNICKKSIDQNPDSKRHICQ